MGQTIRASLWHISVLALLAGCWTAGCSSPLPAPDGAGTGVAFGGGSFDGAALDTKASKSDAVSGGKTDAPTAQDGAAKPDAGPPPTPCAANDACDDGKIGRAHV